MNRRYGSRGRGIAIAIGLALTVGAGSARAQDQEPPGPPGPPGAEAMAPQAPPPPEAPTPQQYDPNVYVAGPTLYPASLPPDPIPEYRPAMPGYGYAWVTGYWDWTGYDWAWDNGYWTAPRPGWFYVGPRFIWDASGQPIYYRGYWQAPNGYRDYGYGGRGTSVAWMGRPRVEPRYWRTQPGHSMAWRTAPGAPAGGWREAPRFERRPAEARPMSGGGKAVHESGMQRASHEALGASPPGMQAGSRAAGPPHAGGGPAAAHPAAGRPAAPHGAPAAPAKDNRKH